MSKHKKKDNKQSYPFVEIALKNIEKEYDRELERKSSIDNKSAVFLSVNIMFVTFLFPEIPVDVIKDIPNMECGYPKIFAAFYTLGLFIGLILMICSVINLVFAARSANYKHFGIERLKSYADLKHQKSDSDLMRFKKMLYDHYYGMLTSDNGEDGLRDVNTKRVDKMEHGVSLTLVGYLCMVLSILFLKI